jgi:glycosyltransferase involved in cell wall biosynthesis
LYNQILGLAERHSITLLTFTDSTELDRKLVVACKRVVPVPWTAHVGTLAALRHAPRLPLSVGLFRHRKMAEAVSSEIASGSYDLVQLQVVRMAPYLRETAGVPAVLDLLDAAELNMRERARAAVPVVRQLLEIEAHRLGVYERQATERANLSLVISQRDLTYLGNPPRASVLPNGITPRSLEGKPPERTPASIVFSGTMNYFPNVDAATWFAKDIFALVHAAIPSSVFRIVGREPASTVNRLSSEVGITVTGTVPDVADELARASVCVCPMRFGSGMQTKILEAMAVATPLVATSKALEGIPENLHPFLRRADSKADFASEVLRILNDPEPALRRAADGLAAIRRQYTWRHTNDKLEAFYEEVLSKARTFSSRSADLSDTSAKSTVGRD